MHLSLEGEPKQNKCDTKLQCKDAKLKQNMLAMYVARRSQLQQLQLHWFQSAKTYTSSKRKEIIYIKKMKKLKKKLEV